MPEQLTVYTHKASPYAHRVEIALKEAKVNFARYEVDLWNKPEWFVKQVNPAGKVPAVTYGGPQVPADQPSPESHKIAESLVLLELVADLYPDAQLMPKDPVLRAKARFFMDYLNTKLERAQFGFVKTEVDDAGLLKAIEGLQALLPEEDKGTFAVGNQFTIADAAIAPFIISLDICLKNDIGKYAPGVGIKVYDVIKSDPKFARFRSYFNAVHDRDSVKATLDEPWLLSQYTQWWNRTA